MADLSEGSAQGDSVKGPVRRPQVGEPVSGPQLGDPRIGESVQALSEGPRGRIPAGIRDPRFFNSFLLVLIVPFLLK